MVTYRARSRGWSRPAVRPAGGAGAGCRHAAAPQAPERREMTEEERKKAREDAEKQIEEMRSQPPAMVEFTLFFDDWRDVDGIKFPHKMRRAIGRHDHRGVDGRQGEGQPEDRPEEVRGLKGAVNVTTPSNADRAGDGRSLLARRRQPAAAQRPQTATLRVVVKDPSGAVIPGAIGAAHSGSKDRPRSRAAATVMSDGQGVAAARTWRRAGIGWTSASPASSRTSHPSAPARRRQPARGDAADSRGRRERGGRPRSGHERLRSEQRSLRQRAEPRTDRRAAGRSRRDGAVLKEMAGPGRHDPRRRVPRRQAAAEVADPLDPVHERHVRAPRTTAAA